MDVKVRFRFNKKTGEVEVFEVDHEGTIRLPEAEHNSKHDRIAAEVGSVIERKPLVTEVLPGAGKPVPKKVNQPPVTDQQPETPKTREKRQKQSE